MEKKKKKKKCYGTVTHYNEKGITSNNQTGPAKDV
jgi:hypothetical protein